MTLLALQTRVTHDGHGPGTIVAYNGNQSSYAADHVGEDAVLQAVTAGLGAGVVSSFYSATRYPYVIKFDSGYQDVYGVDGAVVKVI